MTERLDLYKCNVCGNLVEVILAGAGELVCCGQPMELLQPHTSEPEVGEKHIPVFTITDNDGLEIRVGATLHPMTEEHYIQFIETISNDKNHIELQYFAPSGQPIMLLQDRLGAKKARAFCNIHGLWEDEQD